MSFGKFQVWNGLDMERIIQNWKSRKPRYWSVGHNSDSEVFHVFAHRPWNQDTAISLLQTDPWSGRVFWTKAPKHRRPVSIYTPAMHGRWSTGLQQGHDRAFHDQFIYQGHKLAKLIEIFNQQGVRDDGTFASSLQTLGLRPPSANSSKDLCCDEAMLIVGRISNQMGCRIHRAAIHCHLGDRKGYNARHILSAQRCHKNGVCSRFLSRVLGHWVVLTS